MGRIGPEKRRERNDRSEKNAAMPALVLAVSYKQYGVDLMLSDEGRTQRIPICGENF